MAINKTCISAAEFKIYIEDDKYITALIIKCKKMCDFAKSPLIVMPEELLPYDIYILLLVDAYVCKIELISTNVRYIMREDEA